ncbi:MAG: translation initiation factor IF-3 [Phycisphaeraceae bacterium]
MFLFGGITISRGRFQPSKPVGKQLRINDQVRISPVRLIDENDAQVGVVDLLEAKRRAREAGLDLVEVAPQSQPPVCRVMDYGKWKYQQKKKEQKARTHSKQSELKEVRLRPKIDDHDLQIKMERAREFLGDGDKVQFTMLFRGREMVHRDIGLNAMRAIRDDLAPLSKIEAEPRMMGRRMTMVLAPDRKQQKSEPKPAAAASSQPAAPRAEKPQPQPQPAAP